MPHTAAPITKALALAIGQGEETKLGDLLHAPTGDAGNFGHLHLSGEMYQGWVKAMEQKADHIAELTAAAQSDDPEAQATAKAAAERSKAQFESMQAQAERIKSVGGEVHMESDGLVITSQTELK